MPVSLAGAKASAGVEEPLKGKALKNYLIEHKVPFTVVDVTVQDTEYGEAWEVAIRWTKDGQPQEHNIYLALHSDRDAMMEALREATRDDQVGPLILTRAGKKGWLDFADAEALTF